MFFRDKVAKVSLRDMLEIQERLGTKNFTKALQNEKEDEDDEQPIDETKKSITINKKLSNERVSKSEPIEISSKRQPRKLDRVPVHLRGKRKIVDPRFNEQFGEYDAKEFRQSYNFITDMRRQELKELRKQLKTCEDPMEKTKLKTVINRLKSQVKNVDDLNRVEKISKDIQEKSEKLANHGESTPYITKEVRNVMKLATTYTDLKNTGRIDAYLNKKRKRLASKKKKQMPTRRVNDDDDD
jgi:ribosomal RNA-processing protein 36